MTINPKALGALLVALAMSMGCSGASPGSNPLVHGMESPPDEVVEGCDMAQKKCTRCHTMDQLLTTKVGNPEAWRMYVHRMRLMPGAGIRAVEEPKIVKCLVYRSFGSEGLATLEEKAK
tara:strand:- start:90519 stop:90875 length:357 start_codon:yes stop_codon:yes gene_type:complete